MTWTPQVRLGYKHDTELKSYQIPRFSYHQDDENNISHKVICKGYHTTIF